MIERMKSVCIVSTKNSKTKMLNAIRDLGVLHISEMKAADSVNAERFSSLTKTQMLLSECSHAGYSKPVLSDSEFEALNSSVIKAVENKRLLSEQKNKAKILAEQIVAWGHFNPSDIGLLKDSGIELHFYKVEKKELAALKNAEQYSYIELSPVDKQPAVAVIGKLLGPEIPATELKIPAKGLDELEAEIQQCSAEINECNNVIEKAAEHLASYKDQIIKCKNDLSYSSANATANETDSGLVWISGYIPVADSAVFIETAAKNGWAYIIDDPEEDDEKVPTKVKYNKFTGLLRPVMDILGTVPGYREFDISFWFLSFFAVFFAMIIGDAGYGAVFLLIGIILNIKKKKADSVVLLLYLLSVTTIVWGSLTGTWFGLEEAMSIPFLKNLVLPPIANYPEYFGVDSISAQNTLMQLCFMLGTIQLTLACCINVKTKIESKDLSVLADLGWLLSINSLYYVVLLLVINAKEDIKICGILIGAGFLMVCLFGGMGPGKTFAQGLKSGLGESFTNFLNTISAFGNIMSYIRLFAVGLASLAIAQSFNNMASGFSGPLVVAGVAIMVIGHVLNLVMGLLSVVVHGVRLNLLEFSGQLGMEWSGIAYEPFRKLDK